MKLYHIDRTSHLKEGTKIELIKDFYTDITENEYFKDGLSSHGIRYYLYDCVNKDYEIDAIFEYERRINYKDKLSRYQALFAFDPESVVEFIKKYNLEDNFYKIYEMETNNFEKHNMNLVRGWSHCMISKYAKLYWSDGEDIAKDRKPIYEYLVHLPITLGKEVSLKEIKELINVEEKSENL